MAKILSIEIGYSLTRICEMDYRTKNPKVYKYVSIPTPQGVVEDGFLRENPEFAALVKKTLAENKIKTKQTVFSVTSGKIATREVVLPNVKMSQIDALVKANASDYFPIDLTEYEIASLVLGTIKEEGQPDRFKVMVMAAGKNLIAGYDAFAAQCGLSMISMDYSGNSVFQVMKNECEEDTEMVINVEERSTLATVICAHNLVLQRNVVYGVDDCINTLVESKAFEEDDYKSALDLMKRKTCLKLSVSGNAKNADGDDIEDMDVDDNERILAAKTEISESLMPLISNVGRVVDLYNSKNIEHPIKRIRLVGLGSDISGLSKLFTNELGIRTTVTKLFDSVVWNKSDEETTPGRYIACIGAAIAPVGFINEEKKKSDIKNVNYKNAAILCGVFFVVASAALAVLALTRYNEVKLQQSHLQRLEAEYAPAESVYNNYNNTKAFLTEVMTGYFMTEHPNEGLVAFLEELEEKLPSDAMVEDFTSDGIQAAITMTTVDMEEAAKVIQTLRECNTVMSVSVGGISTKEVDMAYLAAVYGMEGTEEELTELLEDMNLNGSDTEQTPSEDAAADGESAQEATEEQKELKVTRVVFTVTCIYYPIVMEDTVPGEVIVVE